MSYYVDQRLIIWRIRSWLAPGGITVIPSLSQIFHIVYPLPFNADGKTFYFWDGELTTRSRAFCATGSTDSMTVRNLTNTICLLKISSLATKKIFLLSSFGFFWEPAQLTYKYQQGCARGQWRKTQSNSNLGRRGLVTKKNLPQSRRPEFVHIKPITAGPHATRNTKTQFSRIQGSDRHRYYRLGRIKPRRRTLLSANTC